MYLHLFDDPRVKRINEAIIKGILEKDIHSLTTLASPTEEDTLLLLNSNIIVDLQVREKNNDYLYLDAVKLLHPYNHPNEYTMAFQYKMLRKIVFINEDNPNFDNELISPFGLVNKHTGEK